MQKRKTDFNFLNEIPVLQDKSVLDTIKVRKVILDELQFSMQIQEGQPITLYDAKITITSLLVLNSNIITVLCAQKSWSSFIE